MRIDECKGIIVYFVSGIMWQGDPRSVEIDYRSEWDRLDYSYELLNKVPEPMIMDVTIHDYRVEISGEAREVVYYNHELPKMIGYGQ